MPHKDPVSACGFVLEKFRDLPFWPQLPRRNFNENMYVQYSGGLPFLKIDHTANRVYFDVEKQDSTDLEFFYEKYLAEDTDYFAMTEEFSAGFFAFIDEYKKAVKKPYEERFVKGHIIGTVSMGLAVPDTKRNPIIYDDVMADVLSKHLVMKVRWQIGELKKIAKNVVIFIDEPYLTAIGSAYSGLTQDTVESMLNELISAVKAEEAIAGMHCCGNTDWEFMTRLGLDIINFDAYQFCANVALYPDAIEGFLEKGGYLAFGIVPTTIDEIQKEDLEGLLRRLEDALYLLSEKGISEKLLRSNAILTPSCGTGLLSENLAEKSLSLVSEMSAVMRG